jgi:hypothetical protein
LDKQKADRLDNLFREKLQDFEISPAEDYWPYLDKSLDKISFFKFGWKHLNIYNTSVGLLSVILPVVYFLNQAPENKSDKQIPVYADSISAPEKSEDTLILNSEESTVRKKEIFSPIKRKGAEKEEYAERTSSPVLEAERNNDSTQNNKVEELPVIELPEPVKVVEEKAKPKPKRIIYVVEQDTIIQKDTVKVRRKRKN